MERVLWSDINIPNLKFRYQINTSGEVRNCTRNIKHVMKQRKNNSGYYIIDLYTHEGKKTYLVHRLMMLTFSFIVDVNRPHVNHINGVKTDNRYINLEWTNFKENNQHAIDNNLILRLCGEDSFNTQFTNKDVHEICKLLEDNETYDYIIDSLNLHDITNVRQKIIMIKNGYSWNQISELYNISTGRKIYNQVYSDELLHMACRLFEKGIRGKRAIEMLGLEYNFKTQKFIETLYNRKKNKRVSDKYKW